MTNDSPTPVETTFQRYRLSLRVKLVLGFTLLSAFVSFLTARGIYTILQNQVLDEFKNRALDIARLASLQVNGNEFEQITAARGEIYDIVLLQSQRIRSSDPDIKNVYTLRRDDQGFYFVTGD